MSSVVTQLPLRLIPQEDYSFNNFFFSENEELCSVLTDFCKQNTSNYLYLWGQADTGKSHLLMACTKQMQQAGHQVLYLPLAELVESASPVVLDAVENMTLLCLDELDSIAGLPDWEEAVFHCFNRLQHTGCQLLIASQFSPSTNNLQLADLSSRLGLGLIYQLKSLSDSEKQQALTIQAQSRGLILADEVSSYLLRRYGRDMAGLISILQQLDKASMSEQRKLTIPFVRQVLG